MSCFGGISLYTFSKCFVQMFPSCIGKTCGFVVLRLFHISQNWLWFIECSISCKLLVRWCLFFALIVSLYCFNFEQYSVLMSALFGSLCFRFDNFLCCFLNVLQSESNHFSSSDVFLHFFSLSFSTQFYMLLFIHVIYFIYNQINTIFSCFKSFVNKCSD